MINYWEGLAEEAGWRASCVLTQPYESWSVTRRIGLGETSGNTKKEIMGDVSDWLGMGRFGIGKRGGWFSFQPLDLKSRA